MKKKKSIVLLSLILVLVGVLVGVYGFTYAKYVSNSVWDYYLKSKGFYFNSDDLNLNTTKNVNNFWTGESIYFNIRNNLNDIVATDYDINYKVTCTITNEEALGAGCYINGTTSNVYEGILSTYQVCIDNENTGVEVSLLNQETCEIGGYKWENQTATQNIYFDIVNLGDIVDVDVNIQVESTSPYRKVLSGNFLLHKVSNIDEKIDLDYINYSKYDKLVISNSYLKDKCATIIWNSSDLRIDVDRSQLIAYETDLDGYINQIKVKVPSKNTLSYHFYKRDITKSFDATAFSYQEDNEC